MLSLLLTALATASPTPAPSAEPPAPRVHRLKYRLWVDLGVAAGAGALWVGSEALFKKSLSPAQCRWCDRDAQGQDALNPLDAWGRGLRAAPSDLGRMDLASNVVGFGVLPAAVVGLELAASHRDGALAEAPVDLLVVAEAVVLASAVNQGVKFWLGRERPFVHVLPEADKPLTAQPEDNNLSFYSGHSSFAFSLAVAAGTVAQLRGYRLAWLVWAVGLPVAACVPLLRMGADKHYLSDVAVGSAVGAAVGFAVPYFAHGREEAPALSVVGVPGGLGLSARF